MTFKENWNDYKRKTIDSLVLTQKQKLHAMGDFTAGAVSVMEVVKYACSIPKSEQQAVLIQLDAEVSEMVKAYYEEGTKKP